MITTTATGRRITMYSKRRTGRTRIAPCGWNISFPGGGLAWAGEGTGIVTLVR